MRYASLPRMFITRQLSLYGTKQTVDVVCRVGTSDKFTVNEKNRDYKKLPMKGHVILDLGANIGTFALQALWSGADKVICVEPDPDNYVMLRVNATNRRTMLLEGAVVPGDSIGGTTFYSSHKVNRHSLIGRPGQRKTKVTAYGLGYLLKVYKPSVCKIDIEGGEYQLLRDCTTIDDSSLQAVAIEFHLHTKAFRDMARTASLLMTLRGWKPLLRPRSVDDPNRSYCLQGVWVR